jgi:hypothetical protein
VELTALKVQVYGTLSYRVITLVARLPPAVHFGLVYIDTILASKQDGALFGSGCIAAPLSAGRRWVLPVFLCAGVIIATTCAGIATRVRSSRRPIR